MVFYLCLVNIHEKDGDIVSKRAGKKERNRRRNRKKERGKE
jgi:hypothetical protein